MTECALQRIAESLSVPRLGTHDCCLCGQSPYGRGQKLGSNFCGQVLLRSNNYPCAGCSRIMGGRPGSDPPPLRTVSLRVLRNKFEVLDRPALWAAIMRPANEPHVLSWAETRKKHHALRAGVSTPDRLLVGADDTTIVVEHFDHGLASAIVGLLASPTGSAPILSRKAIATGHYHPASLARFGLTERFQDLECVVARHRPSRLLDLLLYCAPLGPPPTKDKDIMIDPCDATASWLLSRLAHASKIRRDDGLRFWKGFFRHRVERCRSLPLTSMISRLTDALACDVMGEHYRSVVAWITTATDDEFEQVAKAIKARPAFLIALAFDLLKQERELKPKENQ